MICDIHSFNYSNPIFYTNKFLQNVYVKANHLAKQTLNMKNIFKSTILFVLLINACFSSMAQKPQDVNIEKQLLTIADTFRTKYRYSEIRLTIDKKVNLTFDGNRYYWLAIPALNDLKTIATVVKITDKIASTSNYCSKILAHEINQYVIGQLIQIEDTLLKQGNESSEALTLITQTITSELKFCTRFTDSYYIFDKLKRRHYSPEAITEIKTLLNHPYKTSEEAKIVLASLKPQYSVLDTLGFVEKTKEYKNILREYDKNEMELNIYGGKAKAANMSIQEWMSINDTTGFKEKFYSTLKRKSELESYIKKIKSWISESEKSKMTLGLWLDSIQKTEDNQFLKNYTKGYVVLWPVIKAIGQSYLNELAPDIEQLIITGILGKNKKDDAKLQLARIQYKDYEKVAVEQITNEIKSADSTDYGVLDKLFEKLVYINTQESFYATSTLLLNKNIWGDHLNQATIGARIFMQLDNYIKNLPFDKKQLIDKVSERGKYDVIINEMVIDYELGEPFLKEIYQWMIANRGKYEIAKE